MQTKLNLLQMDALREVANIGAGHAAIAMSQMLNKKIMIAVTRSDVIPSDRFLHNMVGKAREPVVGVYLQTLGDIQGTVIFMFKKDSSLKFCDLMLLRRSGETRFVDEKCQSALKELGSILTGAFFTVLSNMIEIQAFHKTPMFAFDDPETLVLGVCQEIFGDKKQRLCLATEFIESSSKITGAFAFVPTGEAMETILSKLKNKHKRSMI